MKIETKSKALVANDPMPCDDISKHIFKQGQKVWFPGEKRPYTIRACDDRFAICTKPFNIKKTVLYTLKKLVNRHILIVLRKNLYLKNQIVFFKIYQFLR